MQKSSMAGPLFLTAPLKAIGLQGGTCSVYGRVSGHRPACAVMTTERLPFTIAIVGGGPNCLYIIERLLAHIEGLHPEWFDIAVEVFDAGGHFGSGCHYAGQPSTNHLNRVADQISFGADETNLGQDCFLLDKPLRTTLHSGC